MPAIKEEPNSDSESDPLSSNIDLRKVKVGYVKKKSLFECSVPIWYISYFYFQCSEDCLHCIVIMLMQILDSRALAMLSSKLRELT